MKAVSRQKIIDASVKFTEENLGCKVVGTDIVRMTVRDHRYDRPIDISVGERFPERIADQPGEMVVAIFEVDHGARFLVLTPNRGVIRGLPYLFGNQDVIANSIQRES